MTSSHATEVALAATVPSAGEDVLAPLRAYVRGHATATMTLWHGADTFTDVFLLIRTDGRWRIANKAYHRH